MKRKLLNGFLALAITVAGAGAFSSCKDTNEDMIAQTEQDLRNELEQKANALNDAIKALKEAHDNELKACKEKCEAEIKQLTEKLEKAQKDLQDAIDKKANQTELDALKKRVEKLEKDIQELTQIKAEIESNTGRIEDLESKIGGISTNAADIEELQNILADLGFGTAGTSGTGCITIGDVNYTIQGAVDELINYINGEILSLKNLINDTNNSIADMKAYLEGQIEQLRQDMENNYVTKEEFEAYKDETTILISSLQQQISLNETRITNLENEIEGLKPDIQKGVEAYDWASRNEARIAALESTLDEYKQYVADNYPNNEKLNETVEALKTEFQGKIDQLKSEIDALNEKMDNAISQVTTQIEGINDAITGINTSIGNINTSITNLEISVAGINTRIDELSAAFTQQISDLTTLIAANAVDIAAVKKTAEENKNNIANNAAAIEANKALILANTEAINANAAAILANTEAIEAVKARVDANEAAISALSAKYDELKSELNAVSTKVENLLGMVDRINDRLNKLVTGVLVQATNNPVFGSFALPVGVQSNVLMSYVSWSSTKVTFPNNSSAAEYNNEMWLNSADMNILRQGANFAQLQIEPGDCLLEENEANAGKVFVTINPNTVDFTGATLTLNNSRDEESGITLSPLKKSDELLTFGYTRADNGFYEASAHLTPEKAAEVKIDLEPSLKPAVKEALKNIRDRKFSAGSLIDLGQAIYKQFDGILPAYAMKAAWTAPDINGIDVNHAVYSQYNIAATAFSPLSFKFLYDVNLPNLPIITPIADRAFDLSKFKDKINFKFDNINIDGVTIDDFNIAINFDALNLDFDFDLSGVNITKTENVVINTTVQVEVPKVEIIREDPNDPNSAIKDVKVTNEMKDIPVNVSSPVTITINGNDLEPLADAINDAVQDAINDALKNQLPGIINDQLNSAIKDQVQNVVDKMIREMNTQINDMLNEVAADLNDQIKDLIDDIQDEVNNTINGYIGKVNNYIEKYNSVAERINKYLDNANNYLQAMMVYKGADGAYHQLSNSKSMPTPVKLAGGNAISLLPTTYTGEIAVPVYKKFIGVTNVWKADNTAVSAQNGDATCQSLAKEANDQYLMCTPIMGATHRVPFKASKKGYTYEIVYSALDYKGVTSTRKYYVTVE